MRRRFRSLFLVFTTVAILAGPHAHSAVVVNETFDGYSDTAAMQVNWGASGAATLNVGVGNGGNSALHPGGVVNSWIGSAISLTPTATESIVLSADIFDDGTSANERLTVGLRNGANPLFEMGHYNGTAEHYHVRVLNMYGGENWTPLSPGLNANGLVPGWNRFTATFTPTSLTVTLDLGADGSIEGTFVSNGAASANAFTDLRFGGPSNLSSAGGSAGFDNISLSTVAVPEPTGLSLLGIAALGLAFRRRRD
ncbi:MAG: hypothetical protein Aurels2KO_13550 [Aureliella sp.]